MYQSDWLFTRIFRVLHTVQFSMFWFVFVVFVSDSLDILSYCLSFVNNFFYFLLFRCCFRFRSNLTIISRRPVSVNNFFKKFYAHLFRCSSVLRSTSDRIPCFPYKVNHISHVFEQEQFRQSTSLFQPTNLLQSPLPPNTYIFVLLTPATAQLNIGYIV